MKVKQTQALVFVLLCAQNSEALELSKMKQRGHNNHSNEEFVETQDLGSKMSSLSLNMLNKSQQQESVPSDNVMLQTQVNNWAFIQNTNQLQSNQAKLDRFMQSEELRDHTYLQVQGDDLDDSDIMAYSATAGADEADDSIFSSGGAIMDALGGDTEKTDDEILNSDSAPKKVEVKKQAKKKPAKKVVKKPLKSAAQIKKEKQEMDKKQAEKKKLQDQLKKEKEKDEESAQAQLEREQKMLKDLEDSDKEHEAEMSKDAGGGSGKSFAEIQADDENAQEQSLAKQTQRIVKAAKNKLYGGMMTSFGVFG